MSTADKPVDESGPFFVGLPDAQPAEESPLRLASLIRADADLRAG